MLLHCISEPVVTLIVLVLFDSLFETPVVGKTSYSCMLSKVRPLDVVWVQFIPVGLIGQHSGSTYGLAWSFYAHTRVFIQLLVSLMFRFVQLFAILGMFKVRSIISIRYILKQNLFDTCDIVQSLIEVIDFSIQLLRCEVAFVKTLVGRLANSTSKENIF